MERGVKGWRGDVESDRPIWRVRERYGDSRGRCGVRWRDRSRGVGRKDSHQEPGFYLRK